MRKIAFIISLLLFAVSSIAAESDPLDRMRDYALSFFTPVSGKVASADGEKIKMTFDTPERARPGMRPRILREGAPFVHPVTKEALGRVESQVGTAEITETGEDSASGRTIKGEARQGDRLRIPDTKLRLLFCQEKGIDWSLADEYYRRVKASGRVEMIDTALETSDPAAAVGEGRRLNAEAVMMIAAVSDEGVDRFRQRLIWVSDGAVFGEMDVRIDPSFSRSVRIGDEFFAPAAQESAMSFDLPHSARLITSGDIDGDGMGELVIGTGKDLKVYKVGASLNASTEFIGNSSDSQLWMETADLNADRKDEIIVTVMRSDSVVSSVYGYAGKGFSLLWEGPVFIRKTSMGIVGQGFSKASGYLGDVTFMAWSDGLNHQTPLRLPKGVNIFDFEFVPGGGNSIVAYDDDGYLNVYDESGSRLWKSAQTLGGALTTFKKEQTASYIEAGEWSIKDRIIPRQGALLMVHRTLISDMLKKLGHKSSRIKRYRWNGASLDETILVDNIKGGIADFTMHGDRLFVLSTPVLGLKFGNILKGENPISSTITMYGLRGR